MQGIVAPAKGGGGRTTPAMWFVGDPSTLVFYLNRGGQCMATKRWDGTRVAALMIATLVLGGCGGDGGGRSTTSSATGPTSATAPAPSAAPAQGINVTGTYRGTFNASSGNFAATYTLTHAGPNVTGTIVFDSGSTLSATAPADTMLTTTVGRLLQYGHGVE